MSYTITEEQILSLCGRDVHVRGELVKLFPEAFEDEITMNLMPLVLDKITLDVFPSSLIKKVTGNSTIFINVRGSGKYKGKAFFLSDSFDWKIIKDEQGLLCLIPNKKM